MNLDAVPDLRRLVDRRPLHEKGNIPGGTTEAIRQSPYDYFKEHLDVSSFIPVGAGRRPDRELGTLPQSAEATRLLEQFRATSDRAIQHRIAGKLERVFLRELPFVPLFAGPIMVDVQHSETLSGSRRPATTTWSPDFTQTAYVIALTRIKPRR